MPKQQGIDAGQSGQVNETPTGYWHDNAANEIVLGGCTPTPLANYLKALGVLRLLTARYPHTRGFWRREMFLLKTSLSDGEISSFFLRDYVPTPIMAPWNGGSGFFANDNKTALEAILDSTDWRLESYRSCLGLAESALADMDRRYSPKGEEKIRLQNLIRSHLPDDALGWFDASVLLAGNSAQYPPLLGTGGNDGRLDFTNNFMQRLLDVLPLGTSEPSETSRRWLDTALFANAAPGLAKNAIGQFSPGQAGGPNASIGFEADATVNPWDFVLMIEGALVFAAAAVRRNADDPFGVLSYPFTVRAVGAGSGTLGQGDTANARGELWMPLWGQAATFAEIQALMAEGRVALGRQPARDALDFVRAVQHLGGYRGVQSFQRFGLLMRSGKAYLATPLSRVEISETPQSRWLDDLDRHRWLDKFRRFTNGANVANRYKALQKQLEDQLFLLTGKQPTKAEAQSLLILLGKIQFSLARSPNAREAVPPVPRLAEKWVKAADDGSTAFRIAKALAGLRGVAGQPLPLRSELFPVQRQYEQWMSPEANESARIHIGQKGRLVDTLRAVLGHRLWLTDRLEMPDKPLSGPAGATLEDATEFLRDAAMDERIAELLPGLSLCHPEDPDKQVGKGTVPAAFGLMKLALTPNHTLQSLNHLSKEERLPVPAGMVAQLAAGNRGNRAVKTAWRRLRAVGLAPIFAHHESLPTLGTTQSTRAAAALLIPLRDGATAQLVRYLLDEPEEAKHLESA